MNPRQWVFVLKALLAGGLLWLVFSQLDNDTFRHLWQHMHIGWLIAAIGVFLLGQAISALRMQLIYRWLNQPIALKTGLKLHFISLSYNLLIPGGVGGDGYKLLMLKKSYAYPVKSGALTQLLLRANGLIAIMIWLVLLIQLLIFPERWQAVAVGGLIFAVVCYGGLVHWVCRRRLGHEALLLPLSLLVQLANLATIAALLFALPQAQNAFSDYYLLLFLIASIVGMIPISVGGLGLREATFAYGCTLLNQTLGLALLPEIGVTIALLFFIVNIVAAIPGLALHIDIDDDPEEREHHGIAGDT